MTIRTKRCIACHNEMPATEEFFYKRSGTPGFRSRCRACHNVSAADAPPRVLTPQQRERKRERDREREKSRRRSPEAHAKKMRVWRAANLDKALAQRKASKHKKRAQDAGISGVFTAQQWLDKLLAADRKCHWCGNVIEGTPEVDHVIPLSRGGLNTIDNVVPSCHACNRSKATQLPSEWKDR